MIATDEKPRVRFRMVSTAVGPSAECVVRCAVEERSYVVFGAGATTDAAWVDAMQAWRRFGPIWTRQ